ncbi:hypothetical protein [Candidatus Albibeggiatoa sp. nov. BB20]|uniref:hypothetical protein n=1 Tax=Candidatus Albibeggiatoa sp. nov. BB20 TaxID=3162723 RepID=UPI00336598BD
MELKDFVKEALSQIVVGVSEAQEVVREHGGFVNPAHQYSNSKASSYFGELTDLGMHMFLINFDVAVVVNEDTGTNAQAKLKVVNFLDLSAGGKSNNSNTSTHKISFHIPLALPVDSETKQKLEKKLEEQRKFAVSQNSCRRDESESWSN